MSILGFVVGWNQWKGRLYVLAPGWWNRRIGVRLLRWRQARYRQQLKRLQDQYRR